MPVLISTTKARKKFSEIINRVIYGNEEFLVERQGKPAVLITKAEIGKKQVKTKNDPGTAFLIKIAKYDAVGLPKDFAKNLDKYVWEKYSSS